jgi:hypothetical protein
VLLLFGGAALWQVIPNAKSAFTAATKSPEELAAIEASAYYANCAAARAAGAAPIRVGEPGYREGLDGDGDGVACEPYYGN